VAVLSKLWSAARFTPWLVIVPVHIVMESAADRSPFLLLPPFQDLFSSAEVKIRWHHVAPPFVAPAVVVRLDELRHGRSQSLRTGEHQQIQPRLERLVEPLQLPVGLGVIR